jgi:hypothetical protein
MPAAFIVPAGRQVVSRRGGIVVAEPVRREADWTLWCREFISKTLQALGVMGGNAIRTPPPCTFH